MRNSILKARGTRRPTQCGVPMLKVLPALIAVACTNAYSQSQTQEADNRFGAQSVSVTATKRLQSVQEVSVSVTALDENALEMTGVVDATRLGLIVPGLRVGTSGDEARFAIRGARTNNVGVQAQQVVGVFNDGAYVATTGQGLASYLDVQRVEVLRGPQGTLYGRNTFAGAINVISNQPDFGATYGSVNSLVGSYNRVRAQSVINIPFSNTLAMRVALMGDRYDGMIRNRWLDGPSDDLRNQNAQVARVTLRFRPSADWDTSLRVTRVNRDANGDAIWGYAQIGCYRNNLDKSTATGLSANATYVSGHCWRPGVDSKDSTGASGASTERDQGPWDVSRDGPSRSSARGTNINLQSNYNLGSATLAVLVSSDKNKSLQFFDPDYSNGFHYGQFGQSSLTNFFAGYDNDQSSRSIEVRLASNGNTALKWLFGAYNFKQQANWDYGYLDNGRYLRYSTTKDTYDSSSQALFANASYDLGAGWRVLGGLRSNSDKQKLIGGADGGGGSKPLWRLGLEKDIDKNLMLYTTASTGYRVGGVNGATLVKAGAPAVYGPETVTALEAGFKSRPTKSLTINGAVYNNRYRNMHAQSFVTACIDPAKPATCIASEFTSNGGEINARGAELELNWTPGKQFFLNGSIAFLDAQFGNYLVSQMPGLGNLGGRQDVTRTSGQIVAAGGTPSLQLRGWTPALSPKFTASALTGYVFNLADGNTLTPLAQVSHSARYWSFDYNVPGSEQKAFTKADLRLRWKNGKSGLSVEGYVENLSNQAVLLRSVIFRPDEANVPTASIQANYGDPRTYGIKVGLDF